MFLLEVNNAYNVSILYVCVRACVIECVRQISTAVPVSVDQQYIKTSCFISLYFSYSSLTLKHIQIMSERLGYMTNEYFSHSLLYKKRKGGAMKVQSSSSGVLKPRRELEFWSHGFLQDFLMVL